MMQYEDPAYVQLFLDNLPPMESFAVIFVKANGEGRFLKGTLDPDSTARKQIVPIMTDDGWRSFNINSVLWIGYPDQFESAQQG